MDCVVDASVGIKLYVLEELSDRAEALFGCLSRTEPSLLSVPDLFRVECANILWKHIRRGAYDRDRAMRAMAALDELDLTWVPMASLTPPALAIATTYDVTVYDAVYAALAERDELPLVSADERLRRKLSGSGIRVLSLADYDGT